MTDERPQEPEQPEQQTHEGMLAIEPMPCRPQVETVEYTTEVDGEEVTVQLIQLTMSTPGGVSFYFMPPTLSRALSMALETATQDAIKDAAHGLQVVEKGPLLGPDGQAIQ